MSTIGYIFAAMGIALLLSTIESGLKLLLKSVLRGGIWVLVWWAMASGMVKLLNDSAPTYDFSSLEHLINPLLILLSWLVAYPLCLLLRLSVRMEEGLIAILISMIGALAFWRVVIFDSVAAKGGEPTAILALTCVLSLLLILRPSARILYRFKRFQGFFPPD